VSKRDKPGNGEQGDGQNATPPTFGAGSFGSGPAYGTGVSPQLPPPSSVPGWVPPPGTGPSIGWQAAQQPGGYVPAAGPLASSAGKGDDDLAWGDTRRKTLKNVLLFGAAPLVLAGVVAAAFVLTKSGKPHVAADVGFHPQTASAGAPQVQDASTPTAGTISMSASPSAKPSAKISFPAMPAQSVAPEPGITTTHATAAKKHPAPHHSKPAPSPKPSAKPSPTPASVPVPAELGPPNFIGYCASVHEGSAVNLNGTAYGWHCTSDESTALSTQDVCAYSYNLNPTEAIDVTTDYLSGFTNGIACWSTHGELEPLDVAAYCGAEGWGNAVFGANATEVSCSGSADINENTACQTLFHDNTAFARYSDYSVANSWQCWG
jgi:hypothetical protein